MSTRILNLPVGSYPRWELEDEEMNPEDAEWHNIADRFVFMQTGATAPED